MEYNNYYPGQAEHPSPNLPNHQHTGQQMQSQQPQQQPPPPTSMMHATVPAQSVRHTMNPGTPNQHQQQMQHQQQIIGQHPQQMPPQHHHAHYHQIQPPQSHGAPVSHSSSPHGQHQSDQNLQPSLNGPPPQSAVQSQQHHVHPQSPYHHAGPHMHIQPQPPPPPQPQQQPLNHMVRSSLGPSVISHPHIGLQQPVHNQNFFSGPMPQSSSVHHFSQQNHHHPMPPFQHPQQSMMQQPPLGLSPQQMLQERVSPFYPGILQTEFRVIEMNRRLQARPAQRYPISPLPNPGHPFDEGSWWERFATEFFEDDATITLRMQEDKPVEFTIGRTLIPKFFRTYFDGGVTDLSINLRNPKETCTHPHIITLDCDQATVVTNNICKLPVASSSQGVVVHTEGRLVLEFVNNIDALSIKSWKFYTKGCREFIDRSIIALGLPTAFLVEPITRQGLTKSTVSYLKMCMIMEPMQDIIVLNKHTNLNPRSCMQKLLADRYKFRSGDDGRTASNKRRKRKPSAAPAVTGPTGRKSKATLANIASNNSGLNNNMMVSPSSATSFSLASQDVMVVGEPSMMGGDFGDDNERMITRLENTQYDPTASSALANSKVADGMNTMAGNNNNSTSNGNVALNNDGHSVTPSLLQHRTQQQPPHQQHMPMQAAVSQPQAQTQQTSQQTLALERTSSCGPEQDQVDAGAVDESNQSRDLSQQPSSQNQQPRHNLTQQPHPSHQSSQHQQQSQPQPQQPQHQPPQQQQQSPQQQQQPQSQQQQPQPQPQPQHQDQQIQKEQQQSPQLKLEHETAPQSIEQSQARPTIEFAEQGRHDFENNNNNSDESQPLHPDHSTSKGEDLQFQLEPKSQPTQTDSQTSFSQSEQAEGQQSSEANFDQKPVEKTADECEVEQEHRLDDEGSGEKERVGSTKEAAKAQVMDINSVEQIELNHTNSVQTMNDESNSNSSQLPCAQVPATGEQKQPVDNGVT